MKTVFQLDDEGYLLWTVTADDDPLAPGRFLIASGCVETAPPSLAANEAAFWTGTLWEKHPDYRGSAYWLPDGSRHEIEARNVAPPSTALPAPPPKPLVEVMAEKLAALARLRYRKETAGINIGGALVKTDRESQAALTGAYTTLRNGLLQRLDWKAEGGVWVSLTLAHVEPLAAAVAAHVQACFAHEKAHAQAIGDLATVAAVDAYDISTGWPV